MKDYWCDDRVGNPPWIRVNPDVMFVDHGYPRSENNPKYIVVGLCDVRAADSIRISYDFDRDGWVVEQASIFSWDADDKEMDSDWAEVAFVQAWAREKVAAV